MTNRQDKGAALLVGGYGISALNGSILHLLGRIGEALLATTTGWSIHRLSPVGGDREAPDRSTLKHQLTQIAAQDVDVVLIAIAGLITIRDGVPALVTNDEYEDYPNDATLELDWIRDCIRTCRAPRAIIVASAAPASGPSCERLASRWLHVLGTARQGHIVAVDPSGSRGTVLSALMAGLSGAAVDPKTGTITMRSISEYLVCAVPGLAIQGSEDAETLASTPPLAGPWDARLTGRANARAVAPDPEDLVGSVLPGRFRIDRKLARGSFGTVYLARQLAVDRDVAVKVLEDTLDPGSDLGRLFVHEIQSVGRIDHPNVVRIYQADVTAGGKLFFAMELLSGADLQQLIERESRMERERAIGLVTQLLAGLAAAHDAGLVHADVKPANAFVVPGKDRERAVLLDFGLSRLKLPGQPTEAAGGTPAYMAPEQLRDGRVDSRSDLFAIGLVLLTLITGWRRSSAADLLPPLDGIEDATLRRVLARALALSPDDRYQTAGEFAEALSGAKSMATTALVHSPFRHLAPFTEEDRDSMHGRDREIAILVEHVLYRRAVIYTAPSGTGKTSLLRAGLTSRLDALGIEAVYFACRASPSGALASAIWAGAEGVAAAVMARVGRDHRRLVVIVDQLEEAVIASDPILAELASLERLPSASHISIVLAVREDFLASLMARDGFQSVPVVRLGPLTLAAAREAIVRPLLERRIAITDELLEEILADLGAAGLTIAPEMRWSQTEAIYPPHLQLACSVLYEALGPGEGTLGIGAYRRLGGLEAIVGEYLDRVLENELSPTSSAAARELLLALVHPNRTRAFCTETELAETVSSRHGEAVVAAVLEALRGRGLVVRLRSPTGELGWELVHDSLVPRVLAWIDRRDLARRRAVELVRYHLRRSRPDRPSLLGTAELRELRDHGDALHELDAEWSRRGGGPFSPARLVQLSRHARRMRIIGVVAALGAAVTAAAVLGYRWLDERERRRQDELIAKADLGRWRLELHAFDWDRLSNAAIPVAIADLPSLDWQLYGPAAEDRLAIADPPRALSFERAVDPVTNAQTRSWLVEARGGDAVLVVMGRGRRGEWCPPSLVPLRRLPGFASREFPVATMVVQVPSCRATFADLVTIPAGEYIRGGRGEPPVVFDDNLTPDSLAPEAVVAIPEFAIDRREVTNGAFRMFTFPSSATSVEMPAYPASPALAHAGGNDYPVADVGWAEARAYCRFLGKDLPSDQEWEKAERGGTMVDGRSNPMPRRNLPWGVEVTPVPAKLEDVGGVGPAPVGSSPGDISPYGVLDLAGNVQEWTRSLSSEGFVVTRGCNWARCNSKNLISFMAIANARARRSHNFEIGFRCVLETSARSAAGSSTR